ncbi:MAG TPA: DUF721 domain-containing protein [Alphaproteobacteria bacterium]|nr:DUF721 domain-containing protein [Alphaproteobacteria bacterium]
MAQKETSPGEPKQGPIERATRLGGPRSLASLMPRLARPALGKRGLAEASLMTDWAAIAGAEIAGHALPERLDFARGARLDGTLHLKVESGWALALQHWEPQLLERINGSLGYKAVARLKLHQGPLPARKDPGPAPAPPLDPARRAALEAEIAAAVASLEDPALRAAAARLGLALLARDETGASMPARGVKQDP